MAKTMKILGPGLPEGGYVLAEELALPRVKALLAGTGAGFVELADGGRFVFQGGPGSPFSFVTHDEPAQIPTRIR